MKQDKQPLYDKLDSLGIEYDKRWSLAKLEALVPSEEPADPEPVEVPATIHPPAYTEEEIENISRSLREADKKPIDVMLSEMTANNMGEVTTPSGIIIPPKELSKLRKSIWEYHFKESVDACVVYRTHKHYTEEVRTYSRSVHGDDFKALAQMFTNKNNK